MNMTIMHSLMMLSKHDNVIDNFQTDWKNIDNSVLTTSVTDFQSESNDNIFKFCDQSYILIASMRIMISEFICTWASWLILMKSDFVTKTEQQKFARIQWIEQHNLTIYTYCLWCLNVKVENAIMKYQALWAEFKKMIFEVKKNQTVDDESSVTDSWEHV